MKNDQFAEIAAGYKPAADRGLLPILPPELPCRVIPLSPCSGGGYPLPPKLDTPEALCTALQELRAQYAPFLRDVSPSMETLSSRQELREFLWSLDGSPPVPKRVPHYEGPTGKHTAVYETVFTCDAPSGKSVFLRFEGVDYIAEVFVNDEFVGHHEGFFAPFEFEITGVVLPGENRLKVVVKNDLVMMANVNVGGGAETGDKIYAATGFGWDDPQVGWHHCPPGFGICNRVFVEVRNPQHITDLFPRFHSNASEVWVECRSCDEAAHDVEFSVSVYGRNFDETALEDLRLVPSTRIATGLGDTLTEAQFLASGVLGKGFPLKLCNGYNRFILPIPLVNPRIWEPDTPWLYEIQVTMLVDGSVVSRMRRQFGVRDFTQDLGSTPKGRFLLNGKEIRLRGANTMGFEQQDILRGDLDRLVEDMLLAKLCNMNFLRITQRPVQSELYDICDRVGLLIQTDMPLFGTIRINQYCETLRQTEEMERLIRSHPCCVIATYINEPFPNSANQPHRMITRDAMLALFDAADNIVHMQNPDRVTKHVDGDYDPPSRLMPDNHCYTMWYNGHGLDMGKLHKGWWLDVKPDWYCGCGEFGAEGLDPEETMEAAYPAQWLREPFDPSNIVRAQTGPFHYFFYETPKTRAAWVAESWRHQVFATKIMTSAFRRNPMINTFAIHLFIDAWPSGWMKTIMDCRRNPKPAFFAYRDCLSPVFCSLRSDRFSFFGGETVRIEGWLASDEGPMDTVLYQVLSAPDDKLLCAFESPATPELFQGYVEFTLPPTARRTSVTVIMAAKKDGTIRHWARETYGVWPSATAPSLPQIPYEVYDAQREMYDAAAAKGATVFLAPMSPGNYCVGGHTVRVRACGMSPLYCVSRDTGHRFVRGLAANDLSWLYDSALDRLSPILEATFEADGFVPVVLSGNQDDSGSWHSVLAMGELPVGRGSIVVNQLLLQDKEQNPAVVALLRNMTETEN